MGRDVECCWYLVTGAYSSHCTAPSCSVSEHFAKAVAYAVGDAIMCESLDEARQLAYHSAGSERYKVVTIDGSLINKAGLMTGGSSNGAILDDHTFRSCTLSAHLAPCMYSPSQHRTNPSPHLGSRTTTPRCAFSASGHAK